MPAVKSLSSEYDSLMKLCNGHSWFIQSLIFFFFRKMLIADINELKYQQEDSNKSNMEEDGEGKEDVTFLKLALK